MISLSAGLATNLPANSQQRPNCSFVAQAFHKTALHPSSGSTLRSSQLKRHSKMLVRSSASRCSARALRRQTCSSVQRRNLAAPASGSYQYETGEESNVKFATRDFPGPTTTLTVVAKAGTRYQTRPGYSDALEKFAFKVRLTQRTACTLLIIGSQLERDPHYDWSENLSCSAETSRLTILVRIWFCGPNFCVRIFLTLPRCLRRLYQIQNTSVSVIGSAKASAHLLHSA